MKLLALLSWSIALFVATPAHAGGLLIPRDGSQPIEVRSQRVEVSCENGLARTTVRQTFVNPHGRPLEALYVFPLAESAALIDVAMEAGGKRLEGLLAERKQARRVYDEIVRTNNDPALVEQISRSSFRLSVFPVLPEEETVIELSWIEHLPLSQGAYTYVYPLGGGMGALPTEQDFSLTIAMRSSVGFTTVSASSDDVEIIRVAPGELIASLERPKAVLDRDVSVTAQVENTAPHLAVEAYREEQGDGWFQVLLTPAQVAEARLVPRDVILVIDTSGSMLEDGKIEQAREAALWLLEHLRPTDRVNVMRFSSEVEGFAEGPVPATPANLARLTEFVQGFEAKGATALGDALFAATALRAEAGRVRTVVLLSDGLPTVGEKDPKLLIEVASRSGDMGLRIFPFGVGEDLNSGLLRGIAAAGLGRAEIFRPGGEIVTRLTSFLARTSSPVMSDLELTIDGVAVYDTFPRTLPHAYLGEEIAISGRYRGEGIGTVTVTALVDGERKDLVRRSHFPAMAGGSSSIKQLFARQKLDYLEEAQRLRLGLEDAAYYAALDSGAYSAEGEIVQEMIDLSLSHGVQCAYTSFLVLLPEDKRRLDPRDAEALAAALERAGDHRAAESVQGEQDYEDSDFVSDSPFEDKVFQDTLLLDHGERKPTTACAERDITKVLGTSLEESRCGALGWLAKHQDEDGKWDCDNFTKHCVPNAACDGIGTEQHDVGVTALAVLSFMAEGHTTRRGIYKQNVVRGIKWLQAQQDFETGLIGPKTGQAYMYDHAIATLAMCEAYKESRSPLIRGTAQKAVGFLHRSRNPYGAWRYDSPPVGDNDTSVTGWCILALSMAKQAGLKVDAEAFTDSLTWFDEVTDPSSGRIGYNTAGSASARISGVNEHYPGDKTEAMTAIGLCCRLLLGQEIASTPLIDKHANLLRAALPVWSAQGETNDMYYWYFGSRAMQLLGGERQGAWDAAVRSALIGAQRRLGCSQGTWDPIGPWGFSGGRVYSTALGAMSLEAEGRAHGQSAAR